MVFIKKIELYVVKQLMIATSLYLGHLMVGYTVAWTSPVIPKLQDVNETPLPYLISETEASWVGSTMFFGTIIGPQISGYLSNIIGRKLCIIIGGCINIIAFAVLVAAKNLIMINTSRIICGLGLGMIAVTNLYYIGEIASSNIRGMMLTFTGVFHTFGCLLVYSLGPFVSYAVIAYVILTFSVIHLLSSIYIPESPVYYVLKGNEEAAKTSLRRLGRDKEIEKELLELIDNVNQAQRQRWEWRELFTIKSNRKAFFITVFCFIFQQSCGIIAVTFFATSIFQNAGSSIDPGIATIIIGFTQFIGTIVTPGLIERFGRRTLLLISIFGCGLTMTVLGIHFYLDAVDHEAVTNLGWLPLATLMINILSYSVGFNIVPNTLVGEMYRPNVRSVGSSTVMTIGWIFSFLSTASFGYIVVAVGNHVMFWIYATINVVAFVFVLLFVPETKGKTLIEIENMLAK